jgi:hypothetical protein
MNRSAFMLPCLAIIACASISGSQSFATVEQYSLPEIGTVVPSQTITAQSDAKTRSFAQAVLDNVDQLRANDHVDSADVTIKIVSTALSSNTTFSGVKALHTQLVTETGTIELCNRTLSADEQRSSNITCDVDHEIQESELRASSKSTSPAQVRVQVELAGSVTMTKLTSTVNFEAQLDANVSL